MTDWSNDEFRYVAARGVEYWDDSGMGCADWEPVTPEDLASMDGDTLIRVGATIKGVRAIELPRQPLDSLPIRLEVGVEDDSEHGELWYAQGLSTDFAASGESLEDVLRRFGKGVAETLRANRKVHRPPTEGDHAGEDYAPRTDRYGEWIEHDGGGCPVHPLDRIVVRLRGGEESPPTTAEGFRWDQIGRNSDITQYHHVCDPDGVPYVTDDGSLREDTKYVVTNKTGQPLEFKERPIISTDIMLRPAWSVDNGPTYWIGKPAPDKYANPLVDWRDSRRRVWR